MREKIWKDKVFEALDDGRTATAAQLMHSRFVAQAKATLDLGTRVAALEDAVAQVASGCKWPECEAPSVAPEPFTCGPGHAALREGATITAGPDTKQVLVTGAYEVIKEDDDAPKRCEPGACELALLTRQQDALLGACDELRAERDEAAAERDALREERDELRTTVERVRQWGQWVKRNAGWVPLPTCGAAEHVMGLLDTGTAKREG